MKRKETMPEGCVEERFVPERSKRREVIEETCDPRDEVSREDTRSSGSRIEENEVRSPWLVRHVVTSKEDGGTEK
jgi:hypothetical protein